MRPPYPDGARARPQRVPPLLRCSQTRGRPRALALCSQREHGRTLAAVARGDGGAAAAGGSVGPAVGRLELRASSGVFEASDYLSNKHDWVQAHDEVLGPFRRVAYTPAAREASSLASRTSTVKLPL